LASRLWGACSLILLVSLASLISLGNGGVAGAAVCTCPFGGQYYSQIYTFRDGWLFHMCIVTFDSTGYYGYPAVCGTTTATTTSATSTTTTTTSYPPRLATVISRTVLGAEFSGLKVRVDEYRYYYTPFSLPLQGMHTFTAPGTATVNGLTYSFLRWEDQRGGVLSTQTSIVTFPAGKTYYAVYEPPSYTLTLYVKNARTGKAVAGASVYLDSTLAGTTNSRGVVVIKKVPAGWHYLGVTKYSGYLPYWATVYISASTFTVHLTPL